jgi:GNAT superfamily N-acetyltransferase
MSLTTRSIDPAEAGRLLPALSDLLFDAVAHGASVNFMSDFTLADAEAYWRKQIEAFSGGDRLWIVAEENGALAGMVMCLLAWQPNQPYRGEVSKMLVHSSRRRRGIGARLMTAVEEAALAADRTLLVLDTGEGGAGERLYRRMGWTAFGAVPGFAYTTEGAPETAVFFYKQLAPTPVWKGRP